MSNRFVVVGKAGAYSDSRMWVVRVFDSRKEAEAYARDVLVPAHDAWWMAIGEWYDRHPLLGGNVNSAVWCAWRLSQPKAPVGCDGEARTEYTVEEVPHGWPEGAP